ncbi:inactive receptor-like serine/threonine-protein kinase [Iris pallida]|uniref:Inactive receptor-like serine/threonine-protein kinase n=1 Tax=Iris pallida TaxID=29817 RepID=A0AAX6HTS2_IRIPA|nr:inactive receptor-like serine/threonine-protein kinase [Iris pallida]
MERFRLRFACFLMWVSLFCEQLELCASVNGEGKALLSFREMVEDDPYGSLSNWDENAVDPCCWFGVECSDVNGAVVALNLKDLCLKGTLAPELGKLIHMKFLVLHNNSFSGTIPREIGELHKLEVLDMGHNNLSGPLPPNLGSILSLEFLVLRSNRFMGNIPPDLRELNALSELLVDEELSSSNRISSTRSSENATIRRLLQVDVKRRHNRSPSPSPSPSPSSSPSLSPTPSKSHSPAVLPPSTGSIPSNFHSPSHNNDNLTPTPLSSMYTEASVKQEFPTESSRGKHKHHLIVYLSIAAGAFCIIALSFVYILCWRSNEVVTVMPWKTGLSGQLQKAFVTGVPSLKRSEVQAACEDFSNVVGTLSDCMLYKGTLSSGTEIAVTSSMATSSKHWSDQSEAQFRKKISLMSKVNHKNFMNLVGYCVEEEPFTRMMVYEYAPNGTLFEHLHIKEAEHLDWRLRLRIIMGIAYCLEHMHQLDPPVTPKVLNSSTIYLSEDYAAKISDLSFGSEEEEGAAETASQGPGALGDQISSQEGIVVHKFGIVLLEIISGRLQFSKDDGLLVLWASSHLSGRRPLRDMVDPTLESFSEEDVYALSEVVRSCIDLDPKRRPSLLELVARLRHITAMPPDAVAPKLSPLWWAELEIVSTESNSLE